VLVMWYFGIPIWLTMAQSMSMILHVLRFLRVGLIIIKDSHLNFDMKCQKISGNTGPY